MESITALKGQAAAAAAANANASDGGSNNRVGGGGEEMKVFCLDRMLKNRSQLTPRDSHRPIFRFNSGEFSELTLGDFFPLLISSCTVGIRSFWLSCLSDCFRL